MKISKYLRGISFFVNVLSTFLLLQGVGKVATVLIIIAVALANFFDGIQSRQNYK